jgi:hypothetical protein
LDRDRTNPHFFWTWTELAWTNLDQSSTVSRFRVFFHCIGHLMGEIYLDSTKYTDRTVISSPRVGIQRCAVINVRTVWSTVPSVRHHPGLGRDGNSPSVPGTLPTFGSWTGTDGKDGRRRISSVPGSPRRSSTDIHGLCSMYILKII